MKKKISILMTVYNSEKYVSKSIQSILNQTYKNFEFIIVDDFSNDKTRKILKKIKNKKVKIYLLQKRLGRTKALNYGLKKCRSNIIAIQDADDISNKRRILISMNELQKNDSTGLVATNFDIINEKGKTLKKLNNRLQKVRDKINLKFVNTIAHSSIIFKKDHLPYSKYDDSFIYAQDYKLILSFLRFSKIKILKKKLLKLRVYKENMSSLSSYKKIRIKENLRLLNFSLTYLNPNAFEKIKIYFMKIKNYIKIFLSYF